MHKSNPSLLQGPALWLVGATLSYLAIPVFIFCLGWLKLPWAILCTLVLGGGLWFALADLRGEPRIAQALNAWLGLVNRRSVAITVAVCAFLVLISGVGGYGYQTGDWTKHEILLKDLVDYAWPVYYDYYGETVGLTYYLAYYLPAALLGKVGGILVANQILVLWTLLGLILSVFWFALLANRSLLTGLSLFLVFSGVSILGFLLRFATPFSILAGAPDLNTSIWQTHPALWAANWQYSPHVRGLFWVPQHVLPGWLITGMVLFVLFTTTTRRSLYLLWAFSALWSPFITIGLTPLLLADLLPRENSRFVDRVRAYLSMPNMVGLLLFLLMGIFYATKLTPITPVFNQGMRIGWIFAEAVSWGGLVKLVTSYALFCFLEFGIYFALDRYRSLQTMPALRWPYWSVFVWLALLPLVVFGQHNDLTMRASIPALFFVAVMVGRNGYRWQGVTARRRALWLAVLVLAALSPMYEIGYQLARAYQRGALYEFELNPERNLAEKYVLDADIMQQYASNIETPFFTMLARTGSAATVNEDDESIIFGDSLTLVDAQLSRTGINPGEQLDLLLLLRAVAPITRNYSIAVRLVDAQNGLWWEEQVWPAGAPTTTWPVARRIWYDNHTLRIPADAPPGLYRIEIYFTDPDTQAKLPARAVASGVSLGEIAPVAYIQVGTEQPVPAYALPSAPTFGGQITLLGSNLAAHAEASATAPLPIELVWRTLERPEKQYTGFVQLLDSAGRLVAQQDHPLNNNFIPSTLWEPGLILHDTYQIELPADLAPGTYELIVGIYDPITGERLPVSRDGTEAGDVVTLSAVNLIP